MTENPADQHAAPTLSAPKRKPFRNKFTTVRLSPDAVERQSRVTLLAWNSMGADAAIAFLNNHSSNLDGRPLDLAVASAAGFEAVEREISARTSQP